MKKKKTLFIHIGTPKTGSSAIRYFLYHNKEVLEKNGVFYPIIEEPNPTDKYHNISNIVLYNSKEDKHPRLKTLVEMQECWNKKFIPIIDSSKADKVLLSDEYLSHLEPDFYNIFDKETFNIKGIVYIRPPAMAFASEYAEMIKNFGYKYTIEQYINSRTYTFYEKTLKHILKIGKENFYVRPYEKIQWKNQNLVEDFLNILNLEINDNFIITENQNVTPSRDKLEIIKIKNFIEPEFSKSIEYSNKLLKIKRPNETKLIESLTDEQILEITKKFMPQIDKIAQVIERDNFFINEFPQCYRKKREKFKEIIIEPEELKVLQEILKEETEEKNAIISLLKTEIDEYKTKLLKNKFFYIEKKEEYKIVKIGFIKIKIKGSKITLLPK